MKFVNGVKYKNTRMDCINLSDKQKWGKRAKQKRAYLRTRAGKKPFTSFTNFTKPHGYWLSGRLKNITFVNL